MPFHDKIVNNLLSLDTYINLTIFSLIFRDWYWHQKEIEERLFNLCETMAPPPLLSHHHVSFESRNESIDNIQGESFVRITLPFHANCVQM